MDAEILKIVGQVAGIGGIALGVLLLVFRDVIRKKIFPMLTKEQAYKLLRLVLVLVWLAALAGIGAWVWVSGQPGNAKRLLPPSEDGDRWNQLNRDFRMLSLYINHQELDKADDFWKGIRQRYAEDMVRKAVSLQEKKVRHYLDSKESLKNGRKN